MLTFSYAANKTEQANGQSVARVQSAPLWVERSQKATKTVWGTVKTEYLIKRYGYKMARKL